MAAPVRTATPCLGKPASPRTVQWLAPCIARWLAQRRARRGNAYSVGYAGLVCYCEAWSLRGIVHSGSAFCLSRQRHGAGMNQVRLHRHATAAVCGSCASLLSRSSCQASHPPQVAPQIRYTSILRNRFMSSSISPSLASIIRTCCCIMFSDMPTCASCLMISR
jgi:hypothetical protein